MFALSCGLDLNGPLEEKIFAYRCFYDMYMLLNEMNCYLLSEKKTSSHQICILSF